MSITKVQIVAGARDRRDFERFVIQLDPDERPKPPTLQSLRAKYGVGDDYDIEMRDEYGLAHRFSLAPLAALEAGTYVQIVFRSVPAERQFPPLEPGQHLLKEYLVAGQDDD